MADNQTKVGHQVNSDQEDVKLQLERQIETAVWIQATAQLSKAILVSKLFFVNGDQDSIGEQKIVIGTWVQAIGQILEAVGVSKELSTQDKEIILQAQKTAITGDFFQSFGAQVTAIGGIEVIQEEQIGEIEFVP